MADAVALDLSGRRRFHVTNIGGAGMSAVATLLAEMGHEVSGHDPAADTPFLEPLRELGVDVHAPGAPGDLPSGVEAVVVSAATPPDHPALTAARAAGVAVVRRGAVLGALCARRQAVAVAGTHGKTTTTALLATVLAGADQQPGWVIGAAVPGLGGNASWGGDGPLVVEADESDGTFLDLAAHAAVVTNLEADHLEHWGDEDALRAAFRRFVAAVPGPAVLCLDDPGSAALVPSARHPVTYGTTAGSDYLISDVTPADTGVAFELRHGADRCTVVVPAAPGVHNARNAAGALALANQLGVPLREGAAALASFRGVARRFEERGRAAGVVLVDSYDHLPTEVAAALAAARSGPWSRVVCCFQPHRFSRTAALWRAFADAFADADLLVITDVYPAGEQPRPGVTGKLVVDAVLDAHPWKGVAWMPSLDDVVAYLASALRPGDLCITLGAGDLTTVPDRLLRVLERRADA